MEKMLQKLRSVVEEQNRIAKEEIASGEVEPLSVVLVVKIEDFAPNEDPRDHSHVAVMNECWEPWYWNIRTEEWEVF
jgi:hypothetical protein